MTEYPDCVRQLISNPRAEFVKAANLLIRIARNIQENPTEEKFKSIKICGKVFMGSLLPVEGAVQCLLEMGFAESNERFLYSGEPGAARLRDMKICLENAINGTVPGTGSQCHPAVENVQKTAMPRMNTGKASRSTLLSEHQIHARLESYFQHVLVYGKSQLQQKARSVIPLDKLKKKAQDRLDEKPEFSTPQGKIPLDISDCLIIELLHWFKYDFFKWVDSPECPKCPGAKRISKGMSSPTQEERMWDANQVEIYTCNDCGSILRYPRYNNPEKLLETRGGRCGEWANCFTLLCIALGYETRHVIDWTDHVWTEVYSTSAKRWIHLDPCENTFDNPLMYEKGWGKKLSLIIGVSQYEIIDVTWRYVENLNEVKSRRSEMFREDWLQGTLSNMSQRRQTGISEEKKNEIKQRLLLEVIELSSPKIKSSVVYEGRTTGSLEWRRARGELGEDVEQKNDISQVIKGKEGTMQVQYFSAEDKYLINGENEAKGWRRLVDSSKSVERKVEDDWKVAYLARTPSTDSGHVCWKFDLKDSGENVVVKSVAIKVHSTTFHSGQISWLLCGNKSSQKIESGQKRQFLDEFKGSKVLSLRAFLTGGDGEDAWQHTQLFRESLDERSSEPQLDVVIEYYTEE